MQLQLDWLSTGCCNRSSSIRTLCILQLQLDWLSQAGLPIWVTEMDVWQRDVNLRAEYLDTVLRMYFSNPAVEGIVLWGFWTQAIVSPLKGALFEGGHLEVI